ncbi:MAG: PAS domain-containing protein, partial [Bacteroidota bacterium]
MPIAGYVVQANIGQMVPVSGQHHDLNLLSPTNRGTLESLLDTREDIYIIKLDNKGRYTYASPSYCKRFDITTQDILGKSSLDYILEEDHAKAIRTIKQCWANPNIPRSITIRKPCHLTHGYLTSKWNFIVPSSPGEIPQEVIGMGVDITTSVRTQTNYDLLLDYISDTIFSIDTKGTIKYASHHWYQSFGYTEAETLEQHFFSFLDEQGQEALLNAGEASRKQGEGVKIQHQVRHKNGQWRWAETKIQFERENGQFVAVMRDITESYQFHETLREREAMLEVAGSLASIGGMSFDPQTGELRWSRQSYEILGVDADFEVSLESTIHCFAPEDQEKVLNMLQRAVEFAEPFDAVFTLILPSGERRLIRNIGRPVLKDGIVVKMDG